MECVVLNNIKKHTRTRLRVTVRAVVSVDIYKQGSVCACVCARTELYESTVKSTISQYIKKGRSFFFFFLRGGVIKLWLLPFVSSRAIIRAWCAVRDVRRERFSASRKKGIIVIINK